MDAYDILFAGGDNAPGVALQVYWNFRANVVIWPALPAAPVTSAEKTTLGAVPAITIVPTKVFKKISLVCKTGEVMHEEAKGNDGGGGKFVLKGRLAGQSDDVEAFIRDTRNADLVFFVEQINGITRMMGDEKIPAKVISASGGSKKVGDQDGPGYDIEIEYFGLVCPKSTQVIPIV